MSSDNNSQNSDKNEESSLPKCNFNLCYIL